jgi:hypothetical protein
VQRKAEPTFGKKSNAMAKSKKNGKQETGLKKRLPAKSNDNMPDQDQIITKITEETMILKGIISRFSKPISEENKQG